MHAITVIIDRFEGDIAICEKPDRSLMNIQRTRLPHGAREGDVLIIKGDRIVLDSAETARRKKSAEDMMKHLWK